MTNDYEAAGSIYDIPPRLKANGEPCCRFLDRSGPRISSACDDCQDYYLKELAARRDAAPVDPYKIGLAQRRAAAATDASRFEDDLKATRLRDLATLRAELDAEEPALRLTTAELADYRAPDPYAAGLKALRAKETR